jgi:hypothetical protein
MFFTDDFNLRRKLKMSIKKSIAVFLAVMMGVALYAAPKKIRITPGALCYAWTQNTINKPDSVPVGGFVDEGTEFAPKNIHRCQELKNIRSGAFIMWEGYLGVPQNGDYRFTMTMNDSGNWTESTFVKIFVNNKLLIYKSKRHQNTLTAQTVLRKGFVKLRIYMNLSSNFAEGITLKFAPAKAMQMKTVTPGGIYHPVSEEQ